ncbi:MAG: hypothetical protein JWL76_59 [Thermoleophilia bacterium]|nr:hypothetical protein [Thermoleophilia bacterium]
MNIGELNKGAVALILVLLLGAGGFLWYSQMYKPAVAAQVTAKTNEKLAQDTLSAAKTKLAAAQKAIEDAKSANSAPDDSVARVQLARKAVPPKKLIDDAAIVLMDLARRADVRTSFQSGGEGADSQVVDPTVAGNLNGATPVDLKFKAAGSYSEMMQFMRLVEDTVSEDDGKLYARDRLFNVVRLEIGGDAEESAAGAGSGFSTEGLDDSEQDANELVARPGEILFTVTVRMYTSSTENAQGLGASADPAAAPTDPTASGGDASGAGAAGGEGGAAATGDPAATDGTTPSVDTATGGAPATDTGAAPAAEGAPA